MLIPFYIYGIEDMNEEDLIRTVIFFCAIIIWWIYLLVRAIKTKNLKNLKYNWLGLIKKAKVTAIKKVKFSQGKWYKIDVYYFEAEDWGITYYSDGYTKWTLLWTSISELQSLYTKYWFTFDENNNKKEELLRKIDESIAEKKYEIENSRLLSKITKGHQLWNLEADRKIVNDWYIAPYRQIDDNKVTVWDTVDIYLNPNNPEKYWIDTDFLF